MIYKVKRTAHKIHIIKKILTTDGLNREDYFEIDCDDINIMINANMGTREIFINTITKGLEFGDEKFYDIPVKDIKRVNLIKKAKLNMESLVQSVDMITYINYIDINNELYSHGIFITENNREEKYLEILETGKENLIDLLENLLTNKDKLSVVKSAKSNFDKVVEAVKETQEDDIEALDKIASGI